MTSFLGRQWVAACQSSSKVTELGKTILIKRKVEESKKEARKVYSAIKLEESENKKCNAQ